MKSLSIARSSHKAVEVDQIEQREYQSPPSLGRKVKRHCARWWWLYVVIFCAGFLIIALCLIYVAMPKIAQNSVNASTMRLIDLQFLDPAPDSITITQSAVLYNTNIFTPTLDSFNASLYLVTNGTFGPMPITTILIPSIHVLRPTSDVNLIQQRVAITDLTQLADYAIQVLTLQNVTSALIGDADLHVGKLPVVTVHYNSSTTYQALNSLKGFNITDIKLNTTAPAGEPNLNGFVYIPNPSNLTVALGNVTLSLSTETSGVVGNATLLDLTITPGNNTLPITATLDEQKALASTDKSGFMNVSIIGTSVVYNDQHIKYYEKALVSNVLNLRLNVKQILADST